MMIKRHCLAGVTTWLFCFMISGVVVAGDLSDPNSALQAYHEKVSLCLETAATLETVLNYLDESTETSDLKNLKSAHDFTVALRNDLAMSQKTGFTVLRSHTLEQIGNFGMERLPDIVEVLKKNGKLPKAFKLPPSFGAAELTTAIAKHAGSGTLDIRKQDIETITSYLDGLNNTFWGIAGYMVTGTPAGAELYQSIAGTGTKLLRAATMPLFDKAVLVSTGQGRELAGQWLALQEKRIQSGLSAEGISEIYDRELLGSNGLSDKDIRDLDDVAGKLNRELIRMKKDMSIRKIEMLKESGQVSLGGVSIDVRPFEAGTGGKEAGNEVLQSRPSSDSLYWPVNSSGK